MSENENGNGIASALASIDGERQKCIARRAELQAEIRALDAEISRFTRAHNTLSGQSGRVANGARTREVEEAMHVLKKKGEPATQSAIVKHTRASKNTVKYALTVLSDRGVVRPTGKDIARSPEYELIATAS